MQSRKVNLEKLSKIGIIVSFLMMFVGIIGFFIYTDNDAITLIIMSFAALFSSFYLCTGKDQPIFRFAVGFCISLALFSQAIFIQNQYFAVLGLVALIVFVTDYIKRSKHMF